MESDLSRELPPSLEDRLLLNDIERNDQWQSILKRINNRCFIIDTTEVDLLKQQAKNNIKRGVYVFKPAKR